MFVPLCSVTRDPPEQLSGGAWIASLGQRQLEGKKQ